MNQHIYTVLKQLYGKYSAEEIALVTQYIRKEREQEQSQAEQKRQLKVVQGKIKVKE